MKNKMKRLLGILLSFALVLGLMPGMSLTAYAETYSGEVDEEVALQAGDIIEPNTSLKLSINYDTFRYPRVVLKAGGYCESSNPETPGDEDMRRSMQSQIYFGDNGIIDDYLPYAGGKIVSSWIVDSVVDVEDDRIITLTGYDAPAPVTHSVTLHTNGGTINSGNITEYTEGIGATLPSDVTKTDYIFDGWFDNEGLSGLFEVTEISATDNENKEYWARWKPAIKSWDSGDCIVTFNNGAITVVKKDGDGNGAMADYTIPQTDFIDPQSHPEGCAPWIAEYSGNFTSVSVAEGVTHIGNNAFSNQFVQSASFPSTLTSIGSRAFYCNCYLQSVTLARPSTNSTLTIAQDAFDVCDPISLAFGTGYAKLYNNETEITAGTNMVSLQGKTLNWVPMAVTLSPNDAQSITVGNSVAFTAAVAPNYATDKTVKWSVGGTNASSVILYSDENCTAGNEINTGVAIETLTVYAKGVSAGSATVTATSNADSEKSASCDVTVNEAVPSKLTLNVGENGKVVMSSGIYGNGEENLLELNSPVDNKGTMIVADGRCITVHEGANVNILKPGKISFYPAVNNTGTITAVPADGYTFDGWYNGETLYSNNAELEYKNISEDLDLTAQFASTTLTPVVSDFTYSAPSDLTYDGTAKTATVVPKEGVTGMGQVTVKYYSNPGCTAELVGSPTNVGTYYVGITVTEGDNYIAVSTVLHDSSWQFTIGKATPTADDFNFTAPSSRGYDGTDKTATVVPRSGVTGMGNVTVKYYSDAACKDVVENPKNVGTYYVGITTEEGTNYSEVSTVLHDGTWQFTINRATPNKDNFTYSAPSDLTYDGNPKSATVIADATQGVEGMGAVTVKYYSDAACSTEAEPVNAGTYYVGITVTEGDNYNATIAVLHGEDWKFTIGKVNPTASDFTYIVPSDLNYDGTAKSATVTAAEGIAGMGAVTVKYYSDAACSTEAEPVNVGTYYVGITVTEGDNYNAATAVLHGEDWKFTIGKINPTANDFVFTAPSDLNYDGTAKSATVTAAEGIVGMGAVTVKYYSDAACSTEAEPVNAGTYYVGITVTEGDNYNATTAVLHGEDWKFTIGKINPAAGDFTYTAPSDLNYDGTAKSATVTAVSSAKEMGEVTVKYYSDAACSTEAEPVNVGTYYVGITVTEGDNYNAATAVLHGEDWKFTIGKITPNVNDFVFTAPSDLNYDGTAKSATVTAAEGIAGMGAVTVKYYSDAACSTEAEPVNVGTYYVGITVTEGDNYNAAATVLHGEDWKFTIGKITPNVNDFVFTAPSNLNYDGTAKSATVTAASSVKGMGEVTVKYYSDAACSTEAEPVNVGTYYVGITVTEGDNYNATTAVLHGEDWKFTINRTNATSSTITVNNRTYDGTEKPLVTEDKSTLVGGEMWYALGENATTVPADNIYTTTIPTATDAGTYYVWYKVVGDANHFDSEAKCIESIIKEQPKDEPQDEPKETPKEVDVTPEVEETTEDNSSEEVPTETQSPYRTEWVDGQWYDSEGNATYKPQGKWYQDSTGWWYQDEDGWYPSSQWQKIDGKWYYFTSDGYMDYSEYRDGFWLGSDGAWVETYYGGGWGEKDGQFWYEDASGWYPVSQWLWINGKCYYFGSDGYRVYNQYVDGYWVNNDGEWEP